MRTRPWLLASLVLAGLAVGGATAAAADFVIGEWQRYDADPEATCADGSEPLFVERVKDPQRVVFYLEGGGGCFSAETCAFDGPGKAYVSDSTPVPALLADRGGIFDAERPDNPVADWSFVYVPYCTGDGHLGTSTHEYAPDLVVQHKGFVNAMSGLDHLATSYPDATQVLVAGLSAGSIPSPLFGALVAERLPDARVVALGDSSGGYPDDPVLNAYVGSLWGTSASIPDWPELAGLGIGDWGMQRLYAYAARRAPEVTFARFDHAYDAGQVRYASLVGVDADELLALIDEHEALAEADGADIASYIAPGDEHTIIDDDEFYTLTVGGVRLRDWVAQLLDGEQPADVRCNDCD